MSLTAEQVYQKYLQKVDKNITNDNISTDRGRFVLIFNESQNKFVEDSLQQRGVDDIRYIQHLLVLDKKITNPSIKQDHFDFSLPSNILDLADVRATASKRTCIGQSIELWEIQPENLNLVFTNEDDKPSFEWRQAPYIVNSGKLSIYTDKTFTIDYILLDYYKYPNKIELLNPNDPESKFNETVNIEWDDKAIDRIISYAAFEFDLNENNPRFQLQKIRQQK